MKMWTTAGALVVAGAMLAGSALAQTPPSSESKDKAPSSATSPATKPDPGMGKSDTKTDPKSDTMKSDTGKSGAMKSDSATKSGRRMAGGQENVKAAQQALKDKGHDPGAIDGVLGPKTQAALKDFQSKEGLKASGQLDAETMAKLGVQAKAGASADTAGSSSPSASPSASPKSSPGTDSAGAGSSAPSSSGSGTTSKGSTK